MATEIGETKTITGSIDSHVNRLAKCFWRYFRSQSIMTPSSLNQKKWNCHGIIRFYVSDVICANAKRSPGFRTSSSMETVL